MAPIFRLEKFPHVCRLCLQAPDSHPVVMVSLSATDPALDDESIGDFIAAITFVISEDKHDLLPKMVCLPCLELLRFFAKYRARITTIHLLMNSLIEVKRSNSVPLVDLFRSKSDLVRTVIKDLDLCTVKDYTVQDLLDEFAQYDDSSAPPTVQAELIQQMDELTAQAEQIQQMDELTAQAEVQLADEVIQDTNLLKDLNTDSDSEESCSTPDESNKSENRTTEGYPVLLESDSSDDYPIVKKMKLPGKSKFEGRKLAPPLKCDKCNFKTYNKHNLKTHQQTHVHRCKEPGCTEVFKTYVKYQRHCSVAHKSFVCEICGLQNPSSSSHKLHMDRHLKKYEHVCPHCQKGHNTKADLRNHIASTHLDSRKYTCETCGLIFRKKSTLDEHMLTHSDTLNYACKICDKKFRRRLNLHKHIKVVHEKVRLPCSHCTNTFQTTYKLKNHIESVHGVQTRFLCDICVQLFDSQDKLDVHRARHDKPNELECPTCLFMFTSADQLGNHMCITYRDDYVCCGRDFRYHSFYNKHMFIKHGVRANVRVKPIPGELVGQMRAKRKRIETCPKCEKTFPTRYQKKQHMKICAGLEGDDPNQTAEEASSGVDQDEFVETVESD